MQRVEPDGGRRLHRLFLGGQLLCDVGNFIANWAIRLDTLSITMLFVVTSVSALVHIYSIGYMADDPHRARFFAYLSLFTFAMLMLVTSDNLLQLFFGWEGVGVASYLLIGFWYEKPSACAAAMKAFIVNRVGDFGLVLGVIGWLWKGQPLLGLVAAGAITVGFGGMVLMVRRRAAR